MTFGVTFLQGFLMARAIGVPISFLDVSALLAAASFPSLLPISISGVGVHPPPVTAAGEGPVVGEGRS